MNTINKYSNLGIIKAVDDLFNVNWPSFGGGWGLSELYASPFQLEEDSEVNSVFSIELPRFNKSEVSVTLKNEVLYIKAKNDKFSKEASTYLPKSRYQSDGISARLENGVLYIKVNKKNKEAPKEIGIEVK